MYQNRKIYLKQLKISTTQCSLCSFLVETCWAVNCQDFPDQIISDLLNKPMYIIYISFFLIMMDSKTLKSSLAFIWLRITSSLLRVILQCMCKLENPFVAENGELLEWQRIKNFLFTIVYEHWTFPNLGEWKSSLIPYSLQKKVKPLPFLVIQ